MDWRLALHVGALDFVPNLSSPPNIPGEIPNTRLGPDFWQVWSKTDQKKKMKNLNVRSYIHITYLKATPASLSTQSIISLLHILVPFFLCREKNLIIAQPMLFEKNKTYQAIQTEEGNTLTDTHHLLLDGSNIEQAFGLLEASHLKGILFSY